MEELAVQAGIGNIFVPPSLPLNIWGIPWLKAPCLSPGTV